MRIKRPVSIITAATAAVIFAIVTGFAASVILTVYPGNLEGWQAQTAPGAQPSPSSTPSVTFVAGPKTPPVGSGSAQLSVGSDGGASAQLRHPGYAGTVLPTPTPEPSGTPIGDIDYPAAADELTEITYSTYVQQAGSGGQAPYIVLDVDYDDDGTRDDQLVFEPRYQGSDACINVGVSAGEWQTWNTLERGCWYSLGGEAGTGPGSVKRLRDITAARPTPKIVNSASGEGGVRVVAGLGAGAWDNFVGNVDKFQIGVGEDPEGSPNLTVYDFEPSAPVETESADVGVTKTADASASVADRDVTYTITVTNNGPGAAAAVELSDTLPGNMTFVSLSAPDGWSCTTPAQGSPGTITCSRASLAVPNAQVFTLVGHIPANARPNAFDRETRTSYFSNSAAVTSSNDPNPDNNSAAASTMLVSCLSNPVVTTNGDAGTGSLRHAVRDACAGSTVTFNTGGFAGPITLTGGELLLDRNLTIQGPRDTGLTVGGNNNSRVFNVASGKTVVISDLTIADGRADSGGGIYNLGDLTLARVTLSGNRAAGGAGQGGAIHSAGGTLFVVNSTVSGNSAETDGGGLFNQGASAATLVNVTVADNRADSDNNGSGDGGGIAHTGSNPLTLRNTIVAGNFKGTGTTASDIFVLSGSSVDSASANNLVGVDTGLVGITNGSNGNQIGTAAAPLDARLGPLADNGGLAKTHLPLPGSPAFNAGSNALAKDRSGAALTTDQRGRPRVAGAAVDVGAVEVNYSFQATAGTPQSAAVNTDFATQLQVTMTEWGRPVAGLTVTFSAPASGASGTFPSGNTAVTDSAGRASLTFRANTTPGSYDVTANVGSGFSTPATFRLTNLPAGTIQFGSASYQREEGGAAATITVTRAGGSAGAASVNFSASGGTATGGASCGTGVDFVAASGTLSWADGDAADKTFSVTLCDDSLHEPDEAVGLALSGLTGTAALGAQATATLTLLDDDPAGGRIEFSEAAYAVAERGGQVVVTVRRVGDTTRAASVEYATDDGSTPSVAVACSATTGLALERCDYTRAAGTLRFAAGEALKTFTVLVNDDSYAEGAEAAALRLSNPTGGAALGPRPSATLQIEDDPAESAGNPLDASEFFVRQHYHDFLSREPDAAGLAFWRGEIESCGADSACREVRRVNVSAAFFLSIEFKETGCLVYHFYTAALERPDRLPGHEEFQRDTQAIQRGVVVGEEGWREKLEANKRAYAEEFVARPEFLALYPLTTAPGEYVDALYARAGLAPSEAERGAAAAEFGGASDISDVGARARALRRVSESEALHERDVSRAFVLMEYFGYLRRGPRAAPDNNLDGYNFWLGKLNAFGGDYIRAEMVKAFISSAEYRQRFGQQ